MFCIIYTFKMIQFMKIEQKKENQITIISMNETKVTIM